MLQESSSIISLAEERPLGHLSIHGNGEADRYESRWVIVLSGGNGDRMTPTIREWLGEDRPKQYCAFTGERTLLQHTIDRALEVVPAERIVHVIGQGHRRFFEEAVADPYASCVFEQPGNRGSAAGVFLAASHIYEADPGATVLVMPSDLFVFPERRFIDYTRRLMQLAEQAPKRMLLMGAMPSNAETDYGWIIPETVNGRAVSRQPRGLHQGVRRLHEKPALRDAERYFEQGCLWNTMVCAAGIQTLWWMGRQHLPEMLDAFDDYRLLLRAKFKGNGSRVELDEALGQIYRNVGAADFTQHFLQRAAPNCRVMPAAQMECSDWGRPERVMESLRKLGLEPNFRGVAAEVCNA